MQRRVLVLPQPGRAQQRIELAAFDVEAESTDRVHVAVAGAVAQVEILDLQHASAESNGDGRELVVAGDVGFSGHERSESACGELPFEAVAHLGRFVDVLDLVALAVLDALGVAVKLQRWMERQVAGWRLADVEVLWNHLLGGVIRLPGFHGATTFLCPPPT